MISEILGDELLEEWLEQLQKSGVRRQELIGEGELHEQCREVLRLLREVARRETRLQAFDLALPSGGGGGRPASGLSARRDDATVTLARPRRG